MNSFRKAAMLAAGIGQPGGQQDAGIGWVLQHVSEVEQRFVDSPPAGGLGFGQVWVAVWRCGQLAGGVGWTAAGSLRAGALQSTSQGRTKSPGCSVLGSCSSAPSRPRPVRLPEARGQDWACWPAVRPGCNPAFPVPVGVEVPRQISGIGSRSGRPVERVSGQGRPIISIRI